MVNGSAKLSFSCAAAACVILLCGAPCALAQSAPEPAPVDESKLPDEQKSLTEVNKELTNPISGIWSIALQESTYWLNMAIIPKQIEGNLIDSM